MSPFIEKVGSGTVPESDLGQVVALRFVSFAPSASWHVGPSGISLTSRQTDASDACQRFDQACWGLRQLPAPGSGTFASLLRLLLPAGASVIAILAIGVWRSVGQDITRRRCIRRLPSCRFKRPTLNPVPDHPSPGFPPRVSALSRITLACRKLPLCLSRLRLSPTMPKRCTCSPRAT
jgi:hypothetical protein